MPCSQLHPISITIIIYAVLPIISCTSIQIPLAVQTTNETYYAYLPLNNACNFEGDGILPGKVQYVHIDGGSVFAAVTYIDQVTFWSVISNGLQIIVIAQEQLFSNETGYEGIVLIPSQVVFTKSVPNRQVVLLSTANTTILFNYAFLTYNQPNNTVSASVVSQQQFSFIDKDINKLIQQCDALQVIYLGKNLYLGGCTQGDQVFVWNASNTHQTILYSIPNILHAMNPNPLYILPSVSGGSSSGGGYGYGYSPPPTSNNNQLQWNAVILTANDTILCQFTLDSKNPPCTSYSILQNTVIEIINRAWGFQTSFQESQLDILLMYNAKKSQLNFPGTIISLFINLDSNVFVQSEVADGTTYLSVFSPSLLSYPIVNITYDGYIVSYGDSGVIIKFSNGTFSLARFIFPVYQIPMDITKTHIDLQLLCVDMNNSSTSTKIQYQMMWTSIYYPSCNYSQIQQNNPTSMHNIYTYKVKNIYSVIGPAFSIYLSGDPALDITLLDQSMIQLNQEVVSVLDMTLVKAGRPGVLIFIFTTIKGRIMRRSAGQDVVLTNHPCGITSNLRGKKIGNSYIVYGLGEDNNNGSDNSSLLYCYCSGQPNMDCTPISQSAVTALVNLQYPNPLEAIQILDSLQIATALTVAPSQSIPHKKQLLGLISTGVVATIYENNTVVVWNIKTGKTLKSIPMGCQSYNQTEGATFFRELYDDLLVLYCYKSSTITQYSVRESIVLFNRVIPLYGFITQEQGSMQVGSNFVYLAVDLDQTYPYPLSVDKTVLKYCCVLRLDLGEFTVSVIVEIIYARFILLVDSFAGVDIVYYNQTALSPMEPSLRLYFQSSWISFNQTLRTCTDIACTYQQYPYQIAFSSIVYNFGAVFNASISFNLTEGYISLLDPTITYQIQLSHGDPLQSKYTASVSYGFKEVCGPIQTYYIYLQSQTDSIFLTTTNQIVTPNKLIGSIKEDIMQILSFSDVLPANNSLSSLIMMVSKTKLSFYQKYYQNIWMNEVGNIIPSQSYCTYFVMQILNTTTIILGSNCQTPNININTPMITVTYIANTIIYTNSTMALPMNIRSLQSIPKPSSPPLIVGISQGPSRALTGQLYLCYYLCASLYISSNISFLIDYDSYSFYLNYVIIGLDLNNISIWVNAPAPTIDTSLIQPDYVISYQSNLQQTCSIIKIVNSTLTYAYIIIGCVDNYYLIGVNYEEQSMNVFTTYRKYTNCQPLNKFKPAFSSDLNIMVIQCSQNIDTIRLDEFQTINSSSISIITGYLQIYSPFGPACNWNGVYSSFPIRIIGLSSAMVEPIFTIYQVTQANGSIISKLLYQQINGIVLDNFLDYIPFTAFNYSPMTPTPIYPNLSFIIHNEYDQKSIPVQLLLPQPYIQFAFKITLYCLFSIANAFTILFMVCWYVTGKNKVRKSGSRSKMQAEQGQQNYSDDEENTENSRKRKITARQFSKNIRGSSWFQTLSRRRQSTKRVTQIQLFQPRYNP